MIKDYKKYTLKTASQIIDALLGQGDALDCYNQLQQEAKSIRGQLENDKLIAETNAVNQKIETEKFILQYIQKYTEENQVSVLNNVFKECCTTTITQEVNKTDS